MIFDVCMCYVYGDLNIYIYIDTIPIHYQNLSNISGEYGAEIISRKSQHDEGSEASKT